MGIQSVVCAFSYAIILASHIKACRGWSFPLFTVFMAISIPYQIGYGADRRLHLDIAMCVLRLGVAFEAIWMLVRLHSPAERAWFAATIYSGILFGIGPSMIHADYVDALTWRQFLTTAATVALLLAACYDRVKRFHCQPYPRFHLLILLGWAFFRTAQSWFYHTYRGDAAIGMDKWITARWIYAVSMLLLAFTWLMASPRDSPAHIAESMEEEKD